ncbi:hypothetical protein ACLOJK_015596 [Asimina triloba]
MRKVGEERNPHGEERNKESLKKRASREILLHRRPEQRRHSLEGVCVGGESEMEGVCVGGERIKLATELVC